MVSDSLYRFTEKAVQDLDEIMEYISVNLSNPTAAKDFYELLLNAIERTIAFPEAGTLVKNSLLRLPNVRKIFIKNYTLFYLWDTEDEALIILRIVYNRRNIDEIIRTLSQ